MKEAKTKISDLTRLGMLFAFAVGPALAVAAFLGLLVMGGLTLGVIFAIIGFDADDLPDAVAFPIGLVAIGLTYLMIQPTSRRVARWFGGRGFPLVRPKEDTE